MSAADEEDDILNSFMKEINQLPAPTEGENSAEQSSDAATASTSPTNKEVVAEGAVSRPPQRASSSVVASAAPIKAAPTEVHVVASSHPIYTYPAVQPNTASTTTGSNGKVAAPDSNSHFNVHNVHDVHRGVSGSSSSSSAAPSGGQFAFATATTTTTTRKAAPPPPHAAARGDKADAHVRKAAGKVWADATLSEWPENDYRLFVGDLAKETTNELLGSAFKKYPSFAMARVVRSTVEVKGRGYGFVSFLDPMDCAKALREMNGKYLGSRPMKISKSSWKDREMSEVKKKEQKKRKFQESLGLI